MSTFSKVTITKNTTNCPDIRIVDTTVFDSDPNSNHNLFYFNSFCSLLITFPDGSSKVYSTLDGQNYIQTTLTDSSKYVPTCKVGQFSAVLTELPTPNNNLANTGNFTSHQNFWWNGNFYQPLSDVFIPDGVTPLADLIQQHIDTGDLVIVTEDEILPKYKSDVLWFQHWCNLPKCLRHKLEQFNCLTVNEPTRRDVCGELYEQILQLYMINYFVINILPTLLEQGNRNPLVIDYIQKVSNYVNSICCNCGCCDECGENFDSELSDKNNT